MWVDRAHRGLGIAGRLLDTLERRAVALGHETIRLYTNRSLAEAQAMYRARGYVEIPRYNADPYADHFFEKRVISEHVEIEREFGLGGLPQCLGLAEPVLLALEREVLRAARRCAPARRR